MFAGLSFLRIESKRINLTYKQHFRYSDSRGLPYNVALQLQSIGFRIFREFCFILLYNYCSFYPPQFTLFYLSPVS